MQEAHGQRWHVETYPHLGRLKQARAEIRNMALDRFDRYESPFEAKLTMRDKSGNFVDRFSLNAWSSIMEDLESNDWLEYVSGLFGVELIADRWRHYAGVFRYLPDDHLGVHVDAGIHPISGLRKHVTCVLYFGAGDGALELWRGTSCAPGPEQIPIGTFGQWYPGETPEPQIHDLIESIQPGLGTLVLFENSDYAWHGTARNEADEDRLVLTVSYLSAGIDAFANKRTRAFFVPRPSEEWDAETYRLRDLRADSERFAEGYRG